VFCKKKTDYKKLLGIYIRERAEWKMLVSIVFTVCQDYKCRSIRSVSYGSDNGDHYKERNLAFWFFPALI